jgi:hypothetical protein
MALTWPKNMGGKELRRPASNRYLGLGKSLFGDDKQHTADWLKRVAIGIVVRRIHELKGRRSRCGHSFSGDGHCCK